MDPSIDNRRPAARWPARMAAVLVAALAGAAQAQPAPPPQPRAPAAPTPTLTIPPPPPPAALPPAAPPPAATVPQTQPPASPPSGAPAQAGQGYGPPPGYGAPQGYGAPPPGYGYGAPPQGYGAPPQGYGAPPPGYGGPGYGAPGYGAPPGYPPGYAPYGAYPPPYTYGAPYGYAPPVEPARRRTSVPMMVGGIVITSAGAIAAIAGSALAASAKDRTIIFCESSIGVSECGRKDSGSRMAGGVALLIVGGVGLAVGVPLWFLGGKRVPAGKDDAPPLQPSAKPTVSLGLGSAKLDWRF